MTIEQKNTSIAVYDGWEVLTGTNSMLLRKNGATVTDKMLDYHKNWASIMPVIEKISKTPLLEADGTPCIDPQDTCYPYTFGMPTNDGKQFMFRFKGFACYESETWIGAAFDAVCAFIDSEIARKQ